MQNKFNEKDSSITFLLALFLPNVLAVFCVIILSMFLPQNQLENSLAYKIISTIISQVAFLITFFIITKTKKVSVKGIKHDKLNFKQVIILILISFCCLFLISPLINVYDSFIVSIGIKEQTLPISLDSPLNFIYLFFALGIVAPISEELIFRGIILQGLEKKGTKNAALISALMFMIMHLSLHQTIYQFLLGIIMALIVIYTNSIFASIFVHFINNSVVLFINYISPSLFDYRFLSTNYIILAFVLFFFALFILYYLLKWLKNIKKEKDKLKICAVDGKTENEKIIVNTTANKVLDNKSSLIDKSNFNNKTNGEYRKFEGRKINYLLLSLIISAVIWALNLILTIGV